MVFRRINTFFLWRSCLQFVEWVCPICFVWGKYSVFPDISASDSQLILELHYIYPFSFRYNVQYDQTLAVSTLIVLASGAGGPGFNPQTRIASYQRRYTNGTSSPLTNVMVKIWDRNPSKSEVIGRCGGDEKTEWSRRSDRSWTLKKVLILYSNCKGSKPQDRYDNKMFDTESYESEKWRGFLQLIRWV